MRLNERQEIALRAVASVFRRERGRNYLVAGDVADALGEAGFSGGWYSGRRKHPMGWTAAMTCKALLNRGLVKTVPAPRSAGWLVCYQVTDEGLEVLREIDAGRFTVDPSERRSAG